MAGSESKAEMMKPLLIKAGIPAALSAFAYICVKIISKPSDSSTKPFCNESLHEESFHSLDSTSLGNLEDKSLGRDSNLVSKLLELETQLEEVQKQEWDIETQFLQYQKLKERELILLEMRNVLVLEKTRVEFLMKEISSMEDEYKRIEELVVEYMKLVDQVKCFKEENRLLETKVKKQWSVIELKMRIVKEQQLRIESKNEELLRNGNEMEKQGDYIEELEDEIGQLKMDVDHLQIENIVLYDKLFLLEKLDSSNFKSEAEMVTKEEYDKVVKELEQLQETQKVEANEITYLKWSNACLRDELMKYHEHLDHTNGENDQTTNWSHDQTVSNWSHDDEPCSSGGASVVVGHQVQSRRRRIIQKFKRWVDGSGKMDDNKCFGCHSVSDDIENPQFVQSRKSCSSV